MAKSKKKIFKAQKDTETKTELAPISEVNETCVANATRESTLTTPSDRNTENKFTLDNAPALSEEETVLATKALNIHVPKKFPIFDRRFVDPPLNRPYTQRIGLISFVPAKGAKPNPEGIYGFAKLRGNFPDEEEADKHAEKIIREVDSYHQIYHTLVGAPFPLTCSSNFSKDVRNIDIKKEATEAIAQEVKDKREKEQKEIGEIKEREKRLLEDVKNEEDKSDLYLTLRTKKAQLCWTYLETEKKMIQMCGLIAKARKEIEELELKDPALKEGYFEKYKKAREEAGLPNDSETLNTTFMKYLVEDADIPAADREYEKLFGAN